MKVAGFYIMAFGVWLIATVIIGGLAAHPPETTNPLPMVQGFLLVAPWTGLVAVGVGIIAAGSAIYDKSSKK